MMGGSIIIFYLWTTEFWLFVSMDVVVDVWLMQWEEIEGSYEQQEYLREILKEHIGGDSSSSSKDE